MAVLADSIRWNDDETIAVWGALKSLLGWVPSIDPKRAHLQSAFDKLNAALAPESRPDQQREVTAKS
jgi:hypothetical protein